MGYIELFILSMIPVIELRGAIPIGMAMGMNPVGIYVSCVLGATLIAFPVILSCRYVLDYMKAKKLLIGVLSKLDKKIEKGANKIGSASFWGLALFVGVPLPSSGAWTASMIASVMRLRLGKTMLSVFLGNVIAGILVMFISSPLY